MSLEKIDVDQGDRCSLSQISPRLRTLSFAQNVWYSFSTTCPDPHIITFSSSPEIGKDMRI